MPSLKSLNRKIASLKNTRKITKAMKMIAFTRYRRAAKAVSDARPYGSELEILTARVTASGEGSHPFMASRPVKKVLVLIFTSERGLCGAMNANLLSKAYQTFAPKVNRDLTLTLVNCGRKGGDYFRKKGVVHTLEQEVVHKKPEFKFSFDLAQRVAQRFEKGEVDEVWLAYTHCQSIIRLTPTLEAVLPVKPGAAQDSAGPMIVEPDPVLVFDAVLRERLAFAIHQAYQNSAAAEHAARMTAMENATTNAGKLIDETILTRNRLRQAAITKELTEIISGVESLREV